jgi:hypothetical protein
MSRPHTATVYGLVASMQSGRFTVEDLLGFLAEGPTTEDEGGGATRTLTRPAPPHRYGP